MTTIAQMAASDPSASAFVSAHAGTGKTKLLVDRLLRLMLAGADPARILCLTYTKAAAAEMAIRLQRRLGGWVTLSDADLDQELAELDVARGAAARLRARALFAQVLDLPGGMRIGTIHAFCQSLLRRFPLEARISPHFQLVDPADARADLERAREAALPEADPAALDALAGLVTADGFAGLVAMLEASRDRLSPALALPPTVLEAAMRRVAGAVSRDEAALIAAAVDWPDEAPLRASVTLAARHGSDGVRAKAARLLDWLALPVALRAEHWDEWVGEFLLDDGSPRGLSVFANKRLAETHTGIIPACEAEQQRIAAVQDERRAHRLAAASAALLRLAAPVLEGYRQAKDRRALLDYSDLIGRTRRLLDDPATGAAWVLFKLDGGLDHLLLDEVQDTAPEQWLIAERLTADFFAGEGARGGGALPRTLFAVGDRKQSIYGFQGADPEAFDRWRARYGRLVTQAGLAWRPTVMDLSFRSTAPVLALVDAVFARPDFAEAGGAPLRHAAHRAGQAGRVDVWPLAPRPEAAPGEPWSIPAQNQPQASAPQTLVNQLAGWIAAQTGGGVLENAGLEGAGRRLRPGDVLVLVRRRGEFDRALVRALKARGVPVAGLDRMVLTEQPAVQDLLALCDTLLLPQDDLTLAECLVSPLGGLSDDSLMQLAAGRTGSLWEALRARAGERADWGRARDFLAGLLARADYASPYDLLVEALGPLGGRARLFARLGPEAAEPVDELLAAALLHAASHPPSLQGFLHWLRLSAAEVKREAEAAGDAVRIMTVHGAKGLEAPLVILPDTTALPPDEAGLVWINDQGTGADLPLWQPNRDFACRAVEQARQAGAAARAREYDRLLYVALTRARDRLLVCGWQLHRPQAGCWYDQVLAGMRALGARASAFDAWDGEELVIDQAQTAPEPEARAEGGREAAQPPPWAGQAPDWRPAPLPPEPALPRPLAPSRPDGIEMGPVPPARSPLLAADQGRFGRGLAMHALLQHLPLLPEAERAAAALRYASQPAHGLADPAQVADQAMAVLQAPGLSALFGAGSRAEQPIAGIVGERVVSGQVDRLAILPDRLLIADYKTSRSPPASPEAVPVLYLRQMAAYRAVLAQLYPGRAVICLLIWTDGAVAMILPDALLDDHAPGAPPVPAAEDAAVQHA
jgi:ATP-dependent helicase/nuclease subunit A